MIAPDRAELLAALDDSALKKHRPDYIALLDERYANPKHGHFNDWNSIFENLKSHQASVTELKSDMVVIGDTHDISSQEKDNLEKDLKKLVPWRKGPFDLFGIHIDTEWRSDWKWSRISPHIDLTDKLVLDVGCGNGYYALRMQGMGAKLVLGVDPSWHYVFQFHALQKYSSLKQNAFVLPFAFEELPQAGKVFNCVFSMGVLYHRKEPVIHLKQLHSMLADDGELVLETLIIEGDNTDVLTPEDRYANMRNVWAVPSIEVLKNWLIEAGFSNLNVIDITMTTIDEQRQTEWMTRYSLSQALDKNDQQRTVEGYPAPLRACLIAKKCN